MLCCYISEKSSIAKVKPDEGEFHGETNGTSIEKTKLREMNSRESSPVQSLDNVAETSDIHVI